MELSNCCFFRYGKTQQSRFSTHLVHLGEVSSLYHLTTSSTTIASGEHVKLLSLVSPIQSVVHHYIVFPSLISVIGGKCFTREWDDKMSEFIWISPSILSKSKEGETVNWSTWSSLINIIVAVSAETSHHDFCNMNMVCAKIDSGLGVVHQWEITFCQYWNILRNLSAILGDPTFLHQHTVILLIFLVRIIISIF